MILSDVVEIKKKIYTYWDENIDENHPLHSVLEQYRSIHPDYEVGIIDKNQIREFLKNDFLFLHEWFDRFNIYALKSDIARLAHLYLNGGFYCDSHIKFMDKAATVELCEEHTEEPHLSYIMSKECGSYKNLIFFQYSVGQDELHLRCLKIAEKRLKDVIDSGKYKAGEYAHDIHVACSNGMFTYLDMDGQVVNPANNANYLFNYFGHIKPNGGVNQPIRPYSSSIVTANNTRANNKHWSVLAQEIDLI